MKRRTTNTGRSYLDPRRNMWVLPLERSRDWRAPERTTWYLSRDPDQS